MNAAPMRDASPESLRRRIFRRDGFRCVYCGTILPVESLTLDHVQPRMRGGDQSEGNIVTSCQTCNAEKGATSAWAFLADRPEQRANFLRYAQGIWPRHRRAILEAVAKRGFPSGQDEPPAP
jgi:5-methylcytosine-specific restriction endonuclease McrA